MRVTAIALLLVGTSSQQAAADTSGPNASGYVWVDNNAPDPVITFDWMDATGGTLLDIEDEDDDWDTVTLPFTFNFFGTDYTQVDVSSNGFLSFDIDNDCNDNYNTDEDTIPHTDVGCDSGSGWGGNPLIAPWFDDLDPGECGNPYYDTFGVTPDRMFVVQYDDVCHDDCENCAPGEGITFEVILFEGSNDIKVQYMDAFFGTGDPDIAEENNGGTATTGLNLNGTTGLQYSFNETVLTDGLAVLYTTRFGVPTGITLDPPTASNEVGSDHTVTATVTDGLGFPVQEADAVFEVTDGPNVGDNNGPNGTALDANGQADFTYTGDGGAGTDTIQACVVDFPELCATATKTWEEPTPSPTATPTPTALAATATPTPTPTPTVAAAVQLPATGGAPSDGGSAALPWLAAIAGAIAISTGGAWLAYERRRTR
ncbi:MAG: hypothetical protein IIA44_08580 [Acidobacteria bacterium]|nr:hypothetical protein [Acidobacteriota bacterium]